MSSSIEAYLANILSAVYGADIREDIYKALKQCSSDVNNPELLGSALKMAIQEKIDDGTISSMTITDGSIGEKKLSSDLQRKLKKSSYIEGVDGSRYYLTVDRSGNLVTNKYYEIPKDGLVADVHIADGEVIEEINNTNISSKCVIDASGEFFNTTSNAEITNGADFSHGITYVVAFNYGVTTNLPCLIQKNGNNLANTTKTYYDKARFEGVQTGMSAWGYQHYSYCLADTKTKRLLFSPDDTVIYVCRISSDASFVGWQNGESYELDNNVVNKFSTDFLPIKGVKMSPSYDSVNGIKRILVYNRALSESEVEAINKTINSGFIYSTLPSYEFLDGIVGLGSPSSFVKSTKEAPEKIQVDSTVGEHTETINGVSRTWKNVPMSVPSVPDSHSFAKSVEWVHITDSVKMGDLFAVEAYPYPYDVRNNSYNVEYSSSDESVLKCFEGVIVPVKEGTAVITAKLSNTSMTCTKTITVLPADPEKTNICEVTFVEYPDLNSNIPSKVAVAIKKAINDVHSAGYDGIKFPANQTYNVTFADYDSDKVWMYVPSDFIIDFNNTKLNIIARSDASSVGINLFVFGKNGNYVDSTATYGLATLCRNSYIKNLTIYGERYFDPSVKYRGSQIARFSAYSEDCGLYNVKAYGTTGWNTDATCSDFDYWYGKDGNPPRSGWGRGRIHYDSISSGKIAEDGTTVNPDPSGAWYCTPNFMELGYDYDDGDALLGNQMHFYKFGKMGISTYGWYGRWYDIFFFDENKNLISASFKQFGQEKYELPEGAVYFKVNVLTYGQNYTSANQGEDWAIFRLYPYHEPTRIKYEKCVFADPEYTAFSMTGGVDLIIKDCFAEQGTHGDWAWAIDFEDGWIAMRHNIIFNTVTSGNLQLPASHHMNVINCVINGQIYQNNDTEDLNIVNSCANKIVLNAKTNNKMNHVFYVTGSFGKASGSAGTNRRTDCTILDKWRFAPFD